MSSRFRFENECSTDTAGPAGPAGSAGPAGPAGPPGPPGPSILDCSNIVDVSGIYFCNGTSITTFSGECITISGCLDMSCNSILDVSMIDFCEDVVLTKPSGGGIAIGDTATGYLPGTNSISIGDSAGNGASRLFSIAIGQGAGNTDQQPNTIAIGNVAGLGTQGDSAIAIGQLAGGISQGANAIALGNQAGLSNQHTNTIILNARNIALNSTTPKAFFVKPIREDSSKNTLFYDPGTGEITFSEFHAHGLDFSCSDIRDVSNIFFCNDTAIMGNVQDTLSISGDFNVNTKDGVENLRVTDTTLVSVAAGTAAVPAINFGLTGTDTDTGIYRQGANQMGFSANGTLEAQISTRHLSVVAGTAAFPSINFGIAGDNNTGIYQVGADQIGFSVAGTLEAEVATTTHLSVVGGSVTNPGVNFGITGTDTNTGMYRIDADTIGFATGGVQKVGVYSADAAPYINGLNVGTTAVIAGIQRLSAVAANSWEDGHMGNSEQIVFTPADMVIGNGNQRGLQVQSSQPAPPLASSRWYGATCIDGIIVCQKVIPKGFSITPGNETITIYTPAGPLTNTTCYISAQAADIASTTLLTNLSSHRAGTATALSTNATTILNGTAVTVLGDGLNILTIYWEAGSALTTSNSPSAIVITMSRV